jgi:hypothetical protein
MIVCILLFNFLYVASSSFNYYNHPNIQLRNAGFKMIIFKEKSLPKFIQNFKGFYELYYNKSVAFVGERLGDYNNLSEEDRTLIETIISLCY